MTTCAQCRFGKAIHQDVTKRQCWGAPPQVVVVAAKHGGVGANFVRPIVNAVDDACALFQLRLTVSTRPDINEPIGKA